MVDKMEGWEITLLDLDLLLTFSICRSVCLTLHMCTNTNTAAVTNTAKEALIRANFRCVCRAVKS